MGAGAQLRRLFFFSSWEACKFGEERGSPAERAPSLEGGAGTRSCAPSAPSPRRTSTPWTAPRSGAAAAPRPPELLPSRQLNSVPRLRCVPRRARLRQLSGREGAGGQGGGGEPGRDFPPGFAGAAVRGCFGGSRRGAGGRARLHSQRHRQGRSGEEKRVAARQLPALPGRRGRWTNFSRTRHAPHPTPPHARGQAPEATKVSASS